MANQEKKQTINRVEIVGTLVKNGLEVRNMGQDDECISGSLVLRTEDGSEHDVNYFAYKYKKDWETKQFTGEESKLYIGYETIINEYQSLESAQEEKDADVIKIGGGIFTANDFVSPKDSTLISTNKIKATFANRLSEQEKEVTPKVAKFEISGVVTKMAQEMHKNEPTGNGIVMIDVISSGGTIIPVKTIIPQDKTEAFAGAGFYEGGIAKLAGKIINTTKVEKIVEKQSFGDDIVKEITTTQKRFEVTGGSPLGTLYDIGFTDEEYGTAQSKRRLKLDEIKNKDQSGQTSNNGFTQAPQTNTNAFSGSTQSAPSNNSNPFAQASSNPFGQQK